MSVENITTIVATQLLKVKEEKGSIALEDLRGVLENVAALLANGSSAVDHFLHTEILKIAKHIESTKNEIIALVPNDSVVDATTGKDIGAAALQLDAVLKSTEEAAQNIMDAADEIQNVVGASAMDQAGKDKINELTGRIYEACNFQDLTGQRITKVMMALDFTESKIKSLISLFANDGTIDVTAISKVSNQSNDTREDAHLKNGPQLPGTAPSQADIDALFSNT